MQTFARFLLLSMAALLIEYPHSFGQTGEYCGFDEHYQPELTQIGGAYMPAFGTVKALMLFIDFVDDTVDVSNETWPVGSGPGYLNSIIDEDENYPSETHANVTTFFNDMSFNNLHLIGTAIYAQAPESLAWYKRHETYKFNIPYWATRHVIEALDEASFDFSDYDRWTRHGAFDLEETPDGVIDMIFACYRIWYTRGQGNGFVAEGWADLGWGGTFYVNDGNLQVQSGYPGSGVTVVGMIEYDSSNPRLENLLHEFGHYFGLPHNYSGGLWSLMGHRYPTNTSFMNSYEREQLGWMSFNDVSVDGTTATLSDFGTTGVAYRIAIPNTDPQEYFLFENHQLLSEYDYVDPNNVPGLYILQDNGVRHVEANNIRIVAGDGRWNWSNPFWIANPYGASPESIAVYKKGTINRNSGLTDKVDIPHTKNGSMLMHAWIDETSTSNQVIAVPRYRGDGKDGFTYAENNVFSPWSGDASSSSTGGTTTIGVEISGTSGNNINVKFYTSNPINAPPSKPQGLVVGLFSQYGFNYPHLEWAAMQEPDVINGGNMEVWRRLKQGGYWGSWTSVVTNLDGDETEYIDFRFRLQEAVVTVHNTRFVQRTVPTKCLSILNLSESTTVLIHGKLLQRKNVLLSLRCFKTTPIPSTLQRISSSNLPSRG